MPSTADTPRARQLGAALRDARDRTNLTIRDVGRALGISHVTVTRWENGRSAPDAENTSAMLAVLGVNGDEREELIDLARKAADPNWVAAGTDRQLSMLMDYEKTATRIVESNQQLIPGLLQTSDYARQIMLGAGATSGEAEQRVTTRMGRRDILTRRKPVAFVALLGEQALYRHPCPKEVMADQLHHLLEMGKRDNITVQAVPTRDEYSPAIEGPFILIEFARGKPVVHLEHYRSSATITDAKDVRDYQAAADTILREAMSPEDTAGLIAERANEMECTT